MQPGDTLQGIAEEYYGSTDGATLIALNNGFMPGSDAQIVPGQNLDLPEYRPMTNNSSNSIAYWQFMDLMSARLTPYIQLPPEETPLLEIFVGIVAVVVAIAVAPELSAEILGVAVTALTTVADMALVSAVAAGTAALIDAAGQGLLVAEGIEQKFNVGEVFDAALSAAVAVKGGIAGKISFGSNAVANAILRAGIINVGVQLAQLAAGRINQIQLSQILVSMAEGGLGEAILPDADTSKLSISQVTKTAAQSVMSGYIQGAISGRPVNPENIFTDLLESEGEDAVNAINAGRDAIALADQKQVAHPVAGKIPAPADTATGWKRAGNAAVSSSSASNDGHLGSYDTDKSVYASMDQHFAKNNSVTNNQTSATTNRWGDAGSAAVNQQTRAAHFMSNQIQQAAAKSDDLNFTPDDAYKIYLAQQAVSSGISGQNASDSAWQSAGRSSVNSNGGFWNRAISDVKGVFQEYGSIERVRSYARAEAITGHRMLDLNTLTPQERSQYIFQVDDTAAYNSSMEATGIVMGSMLVGPEVIGAAVPELFPAVSSFGYYFSSEGLSAVVAPTSASLFSVRAGLNNAIGEGAVDDLVEGELSKANLGSYRVPRELPRDNRTKLPIPDSEFPHSQIGQKSSRQGYTYTQVREWGYDNNGDLVPKRDIDFTDHGRPADHPNPHQHPYEENSTGGTLKRGDTEPLQLPVNDHHDDSFSFGH